MKQNWTKDETEKLIEARKAGRSVAAIGRLLGRSQNSVERKIRGLGLTGRKGEAPAPYKEDREAVSSDHWRHQCEQLNRKYQQALKDCALVDRLVSEIQEMAPKSYQEAPKIAGPRPQIKGSPQSAVLLLSDTHIGKVINPAQTLGFGGYDFPVFLARLKYVEDSIISILRDHTNTEVPELVVAMLGDMLDGALAHGVEAGLRNTLFSQCYNGAHAVAQFLRNLSAYVPKIRVRTVVGNHTRYSNQHRMPTENRFSNFDMFFYALVEALTKDIRTIEWDLNQQPFDIFEVQGFAFYAAHGDHWRGGDKALGIPNHAIGRQISTTTQLFNKHGEACPNYYLSGHWHRSITLPHATGEVMINGGFPGLDNYALAENFNPVDPIQRFFLVHPKYGRAATYDLCLKFAKPGAVSPYTLPPGFPMQ